MENCTRFLPAFSVAIAIFILVSSCGTKTSTELLSQHTDSVPVVDAEVQKEKFLNLDIEQYQIYQPGDTSIVLPDTDLTGVPKDREPANLKAAGNVKRVDDALIFTLRNGSEKILKSNLEDEENTAEYIFMQSLDPIGYWEVLAFYYESFGYILINQTTGKEVYLWNKPVLSPDNKYLLIGSLDIEAGFIPNGFQLWSIENDSLKLQWEKEIENWGAEKLIWTNDNHIWGEQTYRDQVSGELKTRLIKLRMISAP